MLNILAIGSHPDDIELGCAGSLLKFKDMGCKIHYIIMTDGGNWSNKNFDIRIEEQEEANLELGVDETYWLGVEDGNIKVTSTLIDRIESIIISKDIDLVFTNYDRDTHQDHVELSKIVNAATRFCPNVFYYESLTSKGFEPNMFIDISDYHAKKIKVINKFSSQIIKYKRRQLDLVELMKNKDRINGMRGGTTYSEGFIVYKSHFDRIFNKIDKISNKTSSMTLNS
ncbi:PIG-L deacetylase family protein [Virgibacillus halodenitrificans]|uniref:PIG-L deacetylase family protein n=1 Tax=Virgibacillus halodenitrificans TaxID=1482 RepID=UPI000EF50E13|nr:PIG-L deacetylase family protein [Virgibacillus halodenitrificans]